MRLLRPSSSYSRGLRPLARAKKELLCCFWPILGNFCYLVVPLIILLNIHIFCSTIAILLVLPFKGIVHYFTMSILKECAVNGRILGRLGNGRMVGHHNGLLVESPGPRSQSTMEWMRSSGQICV